MRLLGRIALGCLCILPLMAQADTTAVKQLRSILMGFHSMSANFVQKTYDSGGALKNTATGEMALSRPNRFRWQINYPSKQIYLVDGHYFWNYNQQLEQAVKQKITLSVSGSPAALLSGTMTEIESEFTINQPKQRLSAVLFTLIPKDSNSEFESIQLQFHGNQLNAMKLFDKLGQTSEITFTHIQINQPQDPELYRFTPPQGTDVIEGD